MIVVEHHNNGADLATAQLQRAMRSKMSALEIWSWQRRNGAERRAHC
jgi:hypothetical protein